MSGKTNKVLQNLMDEMFFYQGHTLFYGSIVVVGLVVVAQNIHWEEINR
jgi:hypothetical protein